MPRSCSLRGVMPQSGHSACQAAHGVNGGLVGSPIRPHINVIIWVSGVPNHANGTAHKTPRDDVRVHRPLVVVLVVARSRRGRAACCWVARAGRGCAPIPHDVGPACGAQSEVDLRARKVELLGRLLLVGVAQGVLQHHHGCGCWELEVVDGVPLGVGHALGGLYDAQSACKVGGIHGGKDSENER